MDWLFFLCACIALSALAYVLSGILCILSAGVALRRVASDVQTTAAVGKACHRCKGTGQEPARERMFFPSSYLRSGGAHWLTENGYDCRRYRGSGP